MEKYYQFHDLHELDSLVRSLTTVLCGYNRFGWTV
jgi:hypothetical protein